MPVIANVLYHNVTFQTTEWWKMFTDKKCIACCDKRLVFWGQPCCLRSHRLNAMSTMWYSLKTTTAGYAAGLG